jgi:uncharacterized protein YabE (DUF348 family)
VSRHGVRPAPASTRVLRVLVSSIAAVVLLGGTGGWMLTNRTITVSIDGMPRTLHTHAADVAGALAHAGVAVGPRDVVAPDPDRAVAAGMRVTVDRARLVTAVVDGQARQFWTTARSVDAALADLDMRESRLRVSASRSTRLPLSGMRFEVRTEKQVTLTVHGERSAVTTFAATVGELLAERDVVLDPGDESQPPAHAALGSRVEVAYIERRTRTVTVTTPAPVRTQKDADLMLDQVTVLTAGRAGKEIRTVEDTYADGKLRRTRVLGSRVTVQPRPEVRRAGSTPYPPDETGANWAGLARCESHNNPQAVSPNGTYHGLYQFGIDTWERMGGIGLPSEATPREQTYRAILLFERAGAGQWPHCGRYL